MPDPEPPPPEPRPGPPAAPLDTPQDAAPAASPGPAAEAPLGGGHTLRFPLRIAVPRWQLGLMALLGILSVYALWWYVTRGVPEERILPPSKGLSSPSETFASFSNLWFERALTRNLFTTLRRLAMGFGLATAVGVPLGILCGCFPRVQAFFLPMTLFGRNIPVAALIPLTFSLFGIGELQKVMFIFIACVAFVVWDTARAISDVSSSYIDTAYTLGAGTWQTILKVLVPLALPAVFNSLRLLFGLAFGYIMLAEVVKFGGESGGLGDIINTSQRRGPREHVLLVLLIIPMVALVIDRILFWIQSELFPYRYGGAGVLHRILVLVLHAGEDLRLSVERLLGFGPPPNSPPGQGSQP